MRLRLFVLGCTLMFGCAKPAPKPTPPPKPPTAAIEYYPLSVGWKWAYDLEKDGEKILAIYTVLNSVAGGAIVLAGEEHLGYAILPEGLAKQENGQAADFILKNPVAPGMEWAVSDGKAKIVSVGQTVTVPAGTFANCATVEEVRTNPDRIVRTTFAAGVGPVALEYQLADPATGKYTIAMRANLRGLTKPGEDPLGPEKK